MLIRAGLFVFAFAASAHTVMGACCTAPAPSSSGTVPPSCYQRDGNQKCNVTVTSTSVPGDPTIIVPYSLTDDNCDQECPGPPPEAISWSDTTTWEFSITVNFSYSAGGTIKGGLPLIGGANITQNFTVGVGGSATYTREHTESGQLSVSAPACAKTTKKVIIETTPHTATFVIKNDVEQRWVAVRPTEELPPECAGHTINPVNTTRVCPEENSIQFYKTKRYIFDADDEDCPACNGCTPDPEC